MDSCQYISYQSTGYFTRLIVDYINKDEKLTPFYNYEVSAAGIQQAIDERKQYPVNRQLLTDELKKQYQNIALTKKQQHNLEALLGEDTYTICTAHQPVIFTGPLYVIYKVMHAIKLADYLATQFPQSKFVPIFYMGSEDADLDELGSIFVNGEKLEWETSQTGAVGRMLVDKKLLHLVDKMAAQLEVETYGKDLVALFRKAYKEGDTIQHATLLLFNELFKEFGLLTIIPDNAPLKAQFYKVVQAELETQFSHTATTETIQQLSKHYKPQAGGRELNLFYLVNDKRERIEKEGDQFIITALRLSWSLPDIISELQGHPERFSANVILRPLFQETILPNIVFIGGGGELAYWLELKKVFEAANVYYPMLLLRNSFLFVNENQQATAAKLNLSIPDVFKEKNNLLTQIVCDTSNLQLTIANEIQQIGNLYKAINEIAGKIDSSLTNHVAALQHKAAERLQILEKKMLKAEKRKYNTQQRQINTLKEQLFPNGALQERAENFSGLFSKYGKQWLYHVFEHSLDIGQQFAIVKAGS